MQMAKVVKSLHSNWLFRQAGTVDWYPASVPGCNFTDLMDNQLIPDPFYSDNEVRLQWIENEDWEYKTDFFLTESELFSRHWQLVFEGLDTHCDILINGQLVATSCNMFVPVTIDCSPYLLPGENRLFVLFHSPIKRTRPLYDKNGFTYPAENDKSDDKLSVYNRKAPYHFGWDWGPRFVTSGIWRPAQLIGLQQTRLNDVQCTVSHVSEDEALVSFTVSAMPTDIAVDVEITCLNADLPPLQGKLAGTECHLNLSISNPKLWWPNGLGEAFLYEFEVLLKHADTLLDSTCRKIGIRTIEVVNEADHDGVSFYFKVNGHPVFMKGANYIPDDSFPHRVDHGRLKKTFKNAVKANMNMLRVWGGGIYQDDAFYDLADEHGILIWQDFMFACTLYPGDEAFLQNVEQEARANITRLRNHPCIAMWCGNNEVEMAISDWQWPEKFDYSAALQQQLQQDYDKLFRQLLPELINELDPQRFYLSSSPMGFWEHQEQDGHGNHHFWGVWHGEQPFSEYKKRIPRFMSEFGFQSFPLIQSVKKYVPQEAQQLESAVMTVHQKHPRGNGLIKKYMLDEYREPKDFASLLYLSQVQQARGLKLAFDAHRKHKPYCMGTLYWQFNDCWPVASWSGIDYYGRWKALHYQAKASFKPITTLIEGQDNCLEIFVLNDTLDDKALSINWALQTFDGEMLSFDSCEFLSQGNQSELAHKVDVKDLLPAKLKSRAVFTVQICDLQGTELCRENHYFVATKDMDLTAPRIKVELVQDDGMCLEVSADVLVKDLHLDIDLEPEGELLNLSDNFFDLLPGETKSLTIPFSQSLQSMSKQQVLARVGLMSVFDTYKQEYME